MVEKEGEKGRGVGGERLSESMVERRFIKIERIGCDDIKIARYSIENGKKRSN